MKPAVETAPVEVESVTGERLDVRVQVDSGSHRFLNLFQLRSAIAVAWVWPLADVILLDGAGCSLLAEGAGIAAADDGAATHLLACRRRPSRAVSGGGDARLFLWDLDAGKALQVFEGHTASVTCVSADFAAERLVSGSEDATLRLWDMASGVSLGNFRGHMGSILCLASDLSYPLVRAAPSNACSLLSGGADGFLKSWDPGSGLCLRTLGGGAGEVTCFSVDFSLQRALCATADGSLTLWDLAASQRSLVVAIASGPPVASLVADFHASRAAGIMSKGDTLCCWDLTTASRLTSRHGPGSLVPCLAADFGAAQRALTTADCGTPVLWDLSAGHAPRRLRPMAAAPVAVLQCVAADFVANRAVTGAEDGSLRTWDMAAGTCLRAFSGHGGHRVRCLAADFGAP